MLERGCLARKRQFDLRMHCAAMSAIIIAETLSSFLWNLVALCSCTVDDMITQKYRLCFKRTFLVYPNQSVLAVLRST